MFASMKREGREKKTEPRGIRERRECVKRKGKKKIPTKRETYEMQ